jgi:DNA-directed RNA polymerase subunit beta
LDKSPKKEFATKLATQIGKMPDSKFKLMVDQISKTKQVPIIIPPFKAPSRQDIAKALKSIGLKTGYKLTLPEYNTKTTNDVPFGYLYIAKLEHIGANKVHSRSTGPTVGKTSQPTAGKSREGGQRMGEGDTWALLSYNCPTVLAEMFGPLSDDIVSKKQMEAEIIETGGTDFKSTKASPTKDLLNAYFVSMMIGE